MPDRAPALPGSRWTVRRVTDADIVVLRALRIASLSDAPAAFGSTVEREVRRTPEDWQRWLATSVTFLVEDAEGAKGLVAGVPDADGQTAWLLAMWVDPSLRGSGAADALVAAVIAWADGLPATTLALHVKRGNTRAMRFYRRLGFEPIGPRPDRDDEVEMRRPLAAGLRS